MSNAQEDFFSHDTPILSLTFSAMTAGVATLNPITIATLFGPSSIVLGFQRTTIGGTVGTPFLAGVDIVSGAGSATIKSTNTADTSTYKLFYINPVPQTNVKAALSLV
jgi:hypothetical protein